MGWTLREKMNNVKSVIVGLKEPRLSSLRTKLQPSTMLESEKLRTFQVPWIMKRDLNTPQLEIEPAEGYITKQAVHDRFLKQVSGSQVHQKSIYAT